jgi:predicted Zn finger-like uncharacterized protein
MAVTQLTCPECSATLRLSEEIPDGKRVRCRKCKTVFVPNQRGRDDDLVPEPVRRRVSASFDEAEVDRPRTGKKKRPKKKKTNPALILIPIAIAVLVLGGGTAAAIYYLSDDKKSEPSGTTKVAAGNPNAGKGNLGANPNAGGNTGLAVGNLAMDIDAEDIDGKQFKLSDYRGKVVVLDFWGNW